MTDFKKVQSVKEFNQLVKEVDHIDPSRDFIAIQNNEYYYPLFMISIVYDIEDYAIIAEQVNDNDKTVYYAHKVKLYYMDNGTDYFTFRGRRYHLSDFTSTDSVWMGGTN